MKPKCEAFAFFYLHMGLAAPARKTDIASSAEPVNQPPGLGPDAPPGGPWLNQNLDRRPAKHAAVETKPKNKYKLADVNDRPWAHSPINR